MKPNETDASAACGFKLDTGSKNYKSRSLVSLKKC